MTIPSPHEPRITQNPLLGFLTFDRSITPHASTAAPFAFILPAVIAASRFFFSAGVAFAHHVALAFRRPPRFASVIARRLETSALRSSAVIPAQYGLVIARPLTLVVPPAF